MSSKELKRFLEIEDSGSREEKVRLLECIRQDVEMIIKKMKSGVVTTVIEDNLVMLWCTAWGELCEHSKSECTVFGCLECKYGIKGGIAYEVKEQGV